MKDESNQAGSKNAEATLHISCKRTFPSLVARLQNTLFTSTLHRIDPLMGYRINPESPP
jgi:hypothetical protein